MIELYDQVRLTRAVPGPDAKVELLALIDRGKRIARKHVASIRSIPVQTEAARNGFEIAERDALSVLGFMSREERSARMLTGDVTLVQSIRGLERLESVIATSINVITTLRLAAEKVAPELKAQFEQADSCKKLDALRRS